MTRRKVLPCPSGRLYEAELFDKEPRISAVTHDEFRESEKCKLSEDISLTLTGECVPVAELTLG